MKSFRFSFCMTLGALACAPLAACGEDTEGNHTPDTQSDIDTDTDSDSSEPQDTDTPVEPGLPYARVHRIDPLSTPELTDTILEHITDPQGALVGKFARVRSCLPDAELGKEVELDIGMPLKLTICHPASRAKPQADGSYLHIQPPATVASDNGEYAELMMYHHMNLIHDYFSGVHGLTDRDYPLDAITNLQAHVDLCDEWMQIANAAFFPEGAFDSLGLPISASDFDINGDAIVFSGTSKRNFAFDASVIYHEYTHAMLGATRLNAAFLDDYGLNNLPGALNEAYADYFAGTLTEASQTGNYALNGFEPMYLCGMQLSEGGDMGRDMLNVKTCANLTAEVHADSEVFSSALWAMRQALGKDLADRAILASVLTLTQVSDFDVAAQATIDAFTELGSEDAGLLVEDIFLAQGIIGCERVVELEQLGARGLALTLEASTALSPSPFNGFIPSYLQYSFTLPEAEAGQVIAGFDITVTMQSQSFSGAQPKVSIALKPGSERITYTIGNTVGSGTHDALLSVPIVNNVAQVRFAEGDNLPQQGPFMLAFHNEGDTTAVSSARLTVIYADPAETEDSDTDAPDAP